MNGGIVIKKVKLFLMDCDGVLTDGGMYYFDFGEAKKFNTKDGMAVKLMKDNGIKVGIISGENSNSIKLRAKKLNIDYVYCGVEDKLSIAKEICKKENILLSEVLYVGDDINDLKLLKEVGISTCPHDAHNIVRRIVDYISNKNGGCGVIRDVYDNVIKTLNFPKNNDIYRLFNIPNISISVNTYAFFKHCQKNNLFNAHIMIRLLAIDCYYGKNDFGWDWYNKMQKERVKGNDLIPKHMANHKQEFIKLIESFEKRGYNYDYPIVLNNEFLFIDGAHRLALALYFNIDRIPITISEKFYYTNNKDYSLKWFDEKGLGYMNEKIILKYEELKEKYEK